MKEAQLIILGALEYEALDGICEEAAVFSNANKLLIAVFREDSEILYGSAGFIENDLKRLINWVHDGSSADLRLDCRRIEGGEEPTVTKTIGLSSIQHEKHQFTAIMSYFSDTYVILVVDNFVENNNEETSRIKLQVLRNLVRNISAETSLSIPLFDSARTMLLSSELTRRLSNVEVVNSWLDFPFGSQQAGISILSYFSEYLEKRYKGVNVSVRIEQINDRVKLIISTEEGNQDIVEAALSEYEQILSGSARPEKYLSDPIAILELKSELRIAQNRIETQREILQIYESNADEKKQYFEVLADALKTKQIINIQSNNSSIAIAEDSTRKTIMEPITMVVEALVAGGVAAAKETASQAVKDGYQGLKELLISYWKKASDEGEVESEKTAEVLLEQLKKDPKTFRVPLETKIEKIMPTPSVELLKISQLLLKMLDEEGGAEGKYKLKVSNAQGVQVGDHNTQSNYFSGSEKNVSG